MNVSDMINHKGLPIQHFDSENDDFERIEDDFPPINPPPSNNNNITPINPSDGGADDSIISLDTIKLFALLAFLFYAISMWSHLFNVFLSDYIIKGPLDPKHLLISAVVVTFLVLILLNDATR